MKRTIIGGFLSIVSSLWAINLCAYVHENLVSEWFESRFWESAAQLGVLAPLIVSLCVLALSVVILCVEYFRKDQQL